MEYKVTTMFQFKVIGFQKEFDYETAYQEIPKFWDEICEKYAANVYAGNELCGNANVEWYDCINGEKTDKDYHSAIWIPVKKKA